MNEPRVVEATEVLAFWREAGPSKWFKKDAAFDAGIAQRFRGTWDAARAGHLAAWEDASDNALALILVVDQFPRNMFRGNSRAFATDVLARAIASRAIERGFDQHAPSSERVFFYLPFEHSEDLADQEHCLSLVRAMNDADLLKWSELHADVIRRFGRFPHRNAVLGRVSTAEEQAFLDAGGFAG